MWTFLLSLAVANPDYDNGVAAAKQKNYPQAVAAFNKCVQKQPKNVDCHWELGWMYWVQNDWKKVVHHWTIVEKSDPKREGLSEYLPQAKDNEAIQIRVAQPPQTKTPKVAKDTKTKIRLRAVGDLMIGTAFPKGYLPPNSGKDTFSDVKSLLKDADITFGNLEGAVCTKRPSRKCKPNAKPGSCYAFRSPPTYIQIYKDAGFDLLSTANNHANDFGRKCRLEAESLLDKANIYHSGRPGDIASFTKKGLKIAMIAFYSGGSSHYLNDHKTAKKLVAGLDKTHDIVIVSFHGGAEGSKALHVPKGKEYFLGEDRGDLRKFSHDVIDAGADIVLGHGPHVLRGMEIYKDKLIAYSLGNFATYGRFSLSGNKGIGVILEAELNAQGDFTSGKLFSTKQINRGIPVKDPENKAISLIKKLSKEDFGKTAPKITAKGLIQKP